MSIYIMPRAGKTPTAFGRVTVLADAAGTGYLSTIGLVRQGRTMQGFRFQAKNTSVAIYFTLDDPEVAINPVTAVQSTVNWTQVNTDASGQLVTDNGIAMATAIKLVFPAAGSVEIACN